METATNRLGHAPSLYDVDTDMLCEVCPSPGGRGQPAKHYVHSDVWHPIQRSQSLFICDQCCATLLQRLQEKEVIHE